MATVTHNERQQRVPPQLIERPRMPECSPLEFCGAACGFFVIPLLTVISAIATGIIGTLSIAGVLPGAAVGTSLIVTGCLAFTASLILFFSFGFSHIRENKSLKITAGVIATLVNLAFIAVGTLGHMQILAAFPIGLVGVSSSVIVVGSAVLMYKK